MSRLHPRRPSPGLVLACVALFVALGGGAYAATSSDTKSDKKIANKAAKSYFNKHIGGASVSHASTATNATNATNAGTASNANALQGHAATDFVPAGKLNRYFVTMSPGDGDVVVDQNGPLSIVAHCGTTPDAELYIRTTADHSAVDAWSQNNDFSSANTTLDWGAPRTTPGYEANVQDGVAIAPDGSWIALVSAGDGLNINSGLFPGKCVFAGAVVNS